MITDTYASGRPDSRTSVPNEASRRLTNQALTSLDASNLHEADIFKLCIRNMDKEKLLQIATPHRGGELSNR